MRQALSAIVTAAVLITGLTTAAMAATVKVTVNNQPITDVDISERAALLNVERRGNSNAQRIKLATDELIDEQLKLQEAARLGINVTSNQVDNAYLSVARNLKLSEDKFEKLLRGSGVNPATLKARLKAAVAWQGVSRNVIAQRVQLSDLELEEKAEKELSAATSYDYILKEVRFIIPKGSGVSTSQRSAQANQYRKNFTGCDAAVDLSLSYTDAAVINIGRRHATQLPDAIAKELSTLNVGDITKPRVTDGGVSMLAICAKTAARDTTFIKNELEQKAGTEQLQDEADKYLEKLHDQAAIVYN